MYLKLGPSPCFCFHGSSLRPPGVTECNRCFGDLTIVAFPEMEKTSPYFMPLFLNARVTAIRHLPRCASWRAAAQQPASSPDFIFTGYNLRSRTGILVGSHPQKANPVQAAFCLHKDSVVVALMAHLSGTVGSPSKSASEPLAPMKARGCPSASTN